LKNVKVITTAAGLAAAGAKLYGMALQLSLTSLARNELNPPLALIEEALNFAIQGAEAVGNKEGVDELTKVRDLVRSIRKTKKGLDKLKAALEKAQRIAAEIFSFSVNVVPQPSGPDQALVKITASGFVAGKPPSIASFDIAVMLILLS
jgi:hypothetical protein